jgi:hypothetical protein
VGSGGKVEPGGFELVVAHLGSRQRGLGVADGSGLDHQRQHVLLAGERQVEPTTEGIVQGRQLGQARQEGGLRQREIGRVHAKVGLGSGLDAVRQVAVIVLVEVDLQDDVLGIHTRQLGGQDGLLDLAPGRLLHPLLRREQDVAGHLLGDRTGARDNPLLREIIVNSSQDRDGIKTRVEPKVTVLGGDRRVDQVLRNLAQGDLRTPPSLRICDFVEQMALAIEDLAADEGSLAGLQFPRRRELVGDGDVADEHSPDGQEENQHAHDDHGKAGPDQGPFPLGRPVASPTLRAPRWLWRAWSGARLD